MNVAGTRALPEPPAGFLTLVPDEAPPPDFGDGWALTPPELEALVLALALALCFGGAVVVDVLEVGVVAGVLAVLDVVVGLAVVAVPVLAGFDPPQPAIASAAINRLETPES